MLYWLARYRPNESSAVWKFLGVPKPTRAYRELRHIDLRVDAEGKQLVLENKVLALPDASQLARYVDDLLNLKEPDYSVGTSWVLLSLAPPAFEIQPYRGIAWRPVLYEELLPELHDTLGRLPAEDAVVFGRYLSLIEDLVTLTKAMDPRTHLDEPFQLGGDDRQRLQEARLLALAYKQQMFRCAEMVRTRLSREHRFDSDMLRLGAGISTKSKAGLVEHFISHRFGRWQRQLGWQLEGDALRMVGILSRRESRTIPESNRGEALKASYPNFFDFDFAPPGALLPYSGRKEWLKYGGEFFYKYQTVPSGTTWRQLIDLLVAASERTRSEVMQLI